MKFQYIKIAVLFLFCLINTTYGEEISFQMVVDGYKNKNYPNVIHLADKLENIKENEKLALTYMLAHSYFNIGKYDLALEKFKDILPYSPYKYEVYNNIGASYFYLKRYQEALDYFKKSIDNNPKYETGLKNYTLLDTAIKRSLKKNKSKEDEGSEYLELLENINLFSLSSKSINDVNLAWMYFYMGKNIEAIHLLKLSIKNDPEYVMIYMSLGYIYDSISNYKSALKYYNQALEIDDEYPDLWNNIGIIYYFTGNEKAAIEHFEKAIELNPNYVYPLNNLGFIYLNKRNIDKAINYFQMVINLEKEDPMILSETYAGLAICNYILNKKNSASEYKKNAIIFNENLSDKLYLEKNLRWDESLIDIFQKKIN